MPSKLNAHLLSAVVLAALLLCAPGAPVEDALTDNPAGDTSGEEGEMSFDPLSDSNLWAAFKEQHKKLFEEEFQDPNLNYRSLDGYKTSAFPAILPKSNFSKEACLWRVAQGLLTYTVLLKHVEKEYPNSQMLLEVRNNCGLLIPQIKHKMRNPDSVTAPTSSQEEQLLKDLDNPDPFHRKMTAHSILSHLFDFVNDGKKAITIREMLRGRRVNRS